MPAIYAHERFGRKVQEQLDGHLKAVTQAYPEAYRIGLQGPDIFFFYRPWKKNRVCVYGEHLHEVTAVPLFRYGAGVVRRKMKKAQMENAMCAEYAYLLGVVCHFTLDSECHPYVGERITESGVEHLEIEEEFEKFLLRADGEDPFTYRTAELIPTDRATARAISPFYPPASEAAVRESLWTYRLVRRVFTASSAAGQNALNGLLKLLGMYKDKKGLLYQRIDHPLCQESSEVLNEKLEAAVPLAVRLMKNLDAYVRGEGKLSRRFDRNFE